MFVRAAPAAWFIGDYPSSLSWHSPGTEHPANRSAQGSSVSPDQHQFCAAGDLLVFTPGRGESEAVAETGILIPRSAGEGTMFWVGRGPPMYSGNPAALLQHGPLALTWGGAGMVLSIHEPRGS